MSFWQNVEWEREIQNISRKELASRADFAVSGISLGLAHDSVPSADVAVRIGNVLGVTVEYLVTGVDAARNAPSFSPPLVHLVKELHLLDSYDMETVSALVHRMSAKP